MKRILLSAAVAALLAGPALAAEQSGAAPAPAAKNSMEVMFGNTLVAKNAKGEEAKLWYNADGTFTGKQYDGADSKGTWAQKEDGSICLKRTEPALKADEPAELCAAPDTTERKVGDSWEIKASDGATYALSIVAGR